MIIKILETNEIGEHYELFPNTYFPNNTPSREWLDRNGVLEIEVEITTPQQSQEELDNIKNELINLRINILWERATKYQENFISGAAIGILTIGVLKKAPKSLAIMSWIQSIWDEYYRQKEIAKLEEPSFEFEICGSIPYSVPELTLEVYSLIALL